MSARYATRASAANAISLREAMLDLIESLRASVTTRLQLAALEGRRAGMALAQMVALGALAAILVITAWLVAVWGIAWGLMELGLQPWIALLIVIGANLLGAWLCWVALKRLTQHLLFPATMRHLQVLKPGADADAAKTATATTTATMGRPNEAS